MNTESAALCCGNRPSTHRSGRPVLVCRSCGDQLQGETAEDTLQAWNRAKDPLGCAEARAADKLAADLREARDRAPHECDLPAPEGVSSDLEGGDSLSRGGGSESGLGGLTGAPESCCTFFVHGEWVECPKVKGLQAELSALKATKRPGGPLKPLGEMLKAVPSEVEQLKADLNTALKYVEDAVNQACQITEATGEIFLDTMCSGTWESALGYLHRLGRVTEILPGRIYAFPWMVEKNAKGATKGAENG